jgi:hypothetical protein
MDHVCCSLLGVKLLSSMEELLHLERPQLTGKEMKSKPIPGTIPWINRILRFFMSVLHV